MRMRARRGKERRSAEMVEVKLGLDNDDKRAENSQECCAFYVGSIYGIKVMNIYAK